MGDRLHLLQPFSMGNLVNASLQLYLLNFRQYVTLAAIEMGWRLLPLVLIVVPLLLFFPNYIRTRQSPFLLFFLVLLVGLIVARVAMVQRTLNMLVLSRLILGAFLHDPARPQELRRQLKPRVFKVMTTRSVTNFLLGLVMFGVILLVSMVTTPIMVVSPGFGLTVLTLLMLVVGLGYSWVMARLLVLEVPMVLEGDLTTNYGKLPDAVRRTWHLSDGLGWHIMGTLLVGFLVTMPLYALVMLPLATSLATAIPYLQSANTATAAVWGLLRSLGLTLLLVILFNVLVMPFWQILKALLYCDLLIRREGWGLSLRDRPRLSDLAPPAINPAES